jgi:hypothetical protein
VGTPVSLIVVHSISLPPGEFGGPQVQALFTNTLDWDAHPTFRASAASVSAHFFIRRTASCGSSSAPTSAPGAGASCHRGRANCNDYSIGIELEGLEGTFESAQYAAWRACARPCAATTRSTPSPATSTSRPAASTIPTRLRLARAAVRCAGHAPSIPTAFWAEPFAFIRRPFARRGRGCGFECNTLSLCVVL